MTEPRVLPEETIVEQPPQEGEGPTPTPKTGGAFFDFITGKQTLDPKTAVDETEKKMLATKEEIKKTEDEIKAKQVELLNKKNELVHLDQDLKRHQGNVGAVFYTKTQGGKKSKKSHKKSKKSHKKTSRKTR